MSIEFAVIGGTGMTEIEGLEVTHREVVHTPYGEPSGPLPTVRLAVKVLHSSHVTVTPTPFPRTRSITAQICGHYTA